MRIAIAQVCQPLAARRPNSDASAARSSRWNGCGSNSRAKASTASRVTREAPNSRTWPTGKSSQNRRGVRAVAAGSEDGITAGCIGGAAFSIARRRACRRGRACALAAEEVPEDVGLVDLADCHALQRLAERPRRRRLLEL